jgi:hypothetical protein
VNLDDLRRQEHPLFDGVPSPTVDLLLQRGHLDAGLAVARSGEWRCARGAAHELAARGERDAAWAVIAPFADTRWWPAVEEAALLLDGWGRGREAITLVRARAEDGERHAWNTLASRFTEVVGHVIVFADPLLTGAATSSRWHAATGTWG